MSQGSHTFSVRAVDAAGNQDATPATRTWTVDTIAPAAPAVTAPAAGALLKTPDVVFSGTAEPNSTVRVAEGALSQTTTATGSGAWTLTVDDVPDGPRTFSATATDAAGNPSTATTRSFTVDAAAPNTSISAGPTGPTNDTTPTFEFGSNEAGSTFQCRVDGAPFAGCPTPLTLAALSEGPHTFQVFAIDPAGNPDTTPASSTFTVDVTAPDTTITAGPTGTITTATAQFTFTSEANTSFRCRVDGGEPAPCTSPHTTATLSEGNHTFEVGATDAAGNSDPTPASRAFAVDTVAPAPPTVIGPDGPTNTQSPSFSFESAEAGSTFRCSLDGGAFEVCTSPKSYSGLAETEHTFRVLVVDAAGLQGAPATRAFTVDVTAPPAPTVEDGPSGATSNSSPLFSFGGSPGTVFACKLDGPAGPGTFGPCTSPATFNALAPGAYTFFIRATDPAGNQTITSRSFTVTAVQGAQPTPTPTPAPAATPVPGKTVVAKVTRGTVLVKLKGKKTFAPLDPANGIPLGSEIDARKGTVQLTAQPKAGAPLDVANFYDGMFIVVQSGGFTELRLSEKLAACKKASASATKPKTRKLWGDGKGKFRTKGQYSSATVRGTKWLTQDTCAGTLTRVTQGVVAVKDLVTKKTILVKQGKRYTAKPKKK